MWEILISPFGRVRFRDFFFADIITSMGEPLKDIAHACFYIYYIEDVDRQVKFDESTIMKVYLIVVSFLPFWWRFWQCINKFHNTKLKVHLLNAGKYSSKLVPPLILVFLPKSKSSVDEMFWLYCLANTFATLYCAGWDYYMDWGLLRSTEKGTYGLRPKIQYPA